MKGHGYRHQRLYYGGTESNESLRESLFSFLELLARGWKAGAAVFIVTGAVVALIVLTRPSEYRAEVLLLVRTSEPADPTSATTAGVIDAPGIGNRNLANQALILRKSLLIAERTAERLIATRTVPETGKPLTMLREDDGSVRDLALAIQSRYVRIAPDDEAPDAIWIYASSSEPAEAAHIANLYAQEYVNRSQETSRQRIMASRSFLEDQLVARREELAQIEEQLKDLNRRGALALDAETQRNVTQIAHLEAMLDEARIDHEVRRTALASMERELEQLHPKLTQRIASAVGDELPKLQSRAAELELFIEQIYVENPGLRGSGATDERLSKLNSELAQTRQRIRHLADAYVEDMLAAGGIDPTTREGWSHVSQLNRQIAEERVVLGGLEAKIGMLERRSSAYAQRLNNIPEQAMQVAQLERAQQLAERVYAQLSEKLSAARVAEASEIGFVEVLRPALTPSGPVDNQANRTLSLGLFFALLLSLGASYIRSRLDGRIHTPEDLTASGYQLLGAVPDMADSIKTEFQGSETSELDGREVVTTLPTLLSPLTAAAEAYRGLHLNLQFSLSDRVAQAILVTSAEAGAGKSITSINLAVTAAQSKRRTLLIGADLRNPVINSYLGFDSNTGVEEVLNAGLKAQDLLSDRFKVPGVPNLYLLSSSTPVANPSRLFTSPELRELMNGLRAVFDVIICDTPPTLVALDSVYLSTQCDITVVVAAAGSTQSDALEQTLQDLTGVGAHIAGIILNRFSSHRQIRYRSTYGYRYDPKRHGYGYARPQKSRSSLASLVQRRRG